MTRKPRTYRTYAGAERRLVQIAAELEARGERLELCLNAAGCGRRPFNWAVFARKPGAERWMICA